MNQKQIDEACLMDPGGLSELRESIPSVVRELVRSCGEHLCYEHVSPAPMPSLEAVIEIINLGRRLLFPGYFHRDPVDRVNLEYLLGQEASQLFELLATQSARAVRHDCIRYGQPCTHCDRRGREVAQAFLKSLPGLRRLLASDVRAALEGDPAVGSPDEVIFSYPGLFAIMVHRMAHVLHHLEVPLIPRMMSEYAHSLTGIDIHPAAHIEGSFFIDHGTGVVVGETARIGERVRLYQGVTLGALSLPRGAGQSMRKKKRHPTIEDDVIIYAQATILGGDTVVGARSVIGGNVWLTESVPPDTKVLVKSPELVYLGKGAGPRPQKGENQA